MGSKSDHYIIHNHVRAGDVTKFTSLGALRQRHHAEEDAFTQKRTVKASSQNREKDVVDLFLLHYVVRSSGNSPCRRLFTLANG